MPWPEDNIFLKRNIAEFRQTEDSFSEHARLATVALKKFLDHHSRDENLIICKALKHFETINNTKNLWDFLPAQEEEVDPNIILSEIEQRIRPPNNKDFNKRFYAIGWIAQNYLELFSIMNKASLGTKRHMLEALHQENCNLAIDQLLITPIQRIMRYPMYIFDWVQRYSLENNEVKQAVLNLYKIFKYLPILIQHSSNARNRKADPQNILRKLLNLTQQIPEEEEVEEVIIEEAIIVEEEEEEDDEKVIRPEAEKLGHSMILQEAIDHIFDGTLPLDNPEFLDELFKQDEEEQSIFDLAAEHSFIGGMKDLSYDFKKDRLSKIISLFSKNIISGNEVNESEKIYRLEEIERALIEAIPLCSDIQFENLLTFFRLLNEYLEDLKKVEMQEFELNQRRKAIENQFELIRDFKLEQGNVNTASLLSALAVFTITSIITAVLMSQVLFIAGGVFAGLAGLSLLYLVCDTSISVQPKKIYGPFFQAVEKVNSLIAVDDSWVIKEDIITDLQQNSF